MTSSRESVEPTAPHCSTVSPADGNEQRAVFAFLADPKTHGLTSPVTRVDTHGAAVFLAGDNVYKIKRPVRFAYMDFSTLDLRRAACEAEIRINRPNAPGIYLDAVPITRLGGQMFIGGEGDVVEWAVHMRRFDESQTLDKLATRQDLSPLASDLAKAVLLAHFHAAPCQGDRWIAALSRFIDEAEAQLASYSDIVTRAGAEGLIGKQRQVLERLLPLLRQRAKAGYVRAIHGDLHLGNVVLLEGKPTLFDAIEFNQDIASGDILYDLAFLLMDLCCHGQGRGANQLLNRYLTGSRCDDNLSALSALPFFLSLRATIRAHVTAARSLVVPSGCRLAVQAQAQDYLGSAKTFLESEPAILVAIGGLSGSGKSTVATLLAPEIGGPPGAVHLRSDVERKAMFGVEETITLPSVAYGPENTVAVYAELRRKAALVLNAGMSVIIDAVHATLSERSAAELVAREVGTAFIGLWLEAPLNERLRRVAQRRGDASDADVNVVRRQASSDLGVLDWTVVDASRPPQEIVSGLIPLSTTEQVGGVQA